MAPHCNFPPLLALAILGAVCTCSAADRTYEANWDSLMTRPLPSWYDEAKVGLFMHWGVFSVPSFGTEWYWYNLRTGNKKTVAFHNKTYGPDFKYAEFAPDFTATFFDPEAWAALFKAAGIKYVVLTSKHHEGFTN